MQEFDIAPDGQSIAVTYGVVGCDYPGDRARIFAVSLPAMTLTPLSPDDRLSVRPHWSRDGRFVLGSDYSKSPSLWIVEVSGGKRTRITRPGDFGSDEFLGWL